MKFTVAALVAAAAVTSSDAVGIKVIDAVKKDVKTHSVGQSVLKEKLTGQHKKAEPWEGWAWDNNANKELPNELGVKGQPLKPVGIGAYQDAAAVAQRTKDARKACEESVIYKSSKWSECYQSKGDYVDGPVFAKGYGAHGKLDSAASTLLPHTVAVVVTGLALATSLAQ